VARPDAGALRRSLRRGQVLHWASGTEGQPALLTGDIIMAVQDRNYVSFLYTYPNVIPLPARELCRGAAAVEPYAFEPISGAWWNRIVPRDAKAARRRSAARSITAIAQ
jgi:hypothetical protein